MHAKDRATTTGRPISTRLTRLHPYPAMVADRLAIELARTYVPAGGRVLDPFCGSGRLLVAASQASHRTGLDVNPLAWLLTKAKLGAPSPRIIQHVIDGLKECRSGTARFTLEVALNGGVEWFAPQPARDLERIVAYIDNLDLPEAELLLVAAALSATVRQVSFAKQGAWKLHRIGADHRAVFEADAVEIFRRRLRYCVKSIAEREAIQGTNDVRVAKTQSLLTDEFAGESNLFDVVLTSPPYGDSRTTVQYGAASALCMSVVSRLRGLENLGVRGAVIDGACLGGPASPRIASEPVNLERYWQGGEASLKRSVMRFVVDYNDAMLGIARSLKPNGIAVLVVGNRHVGGARFALDKLTIEQAARYGLHLCDRSVRKYATKRVPRHVNRFGRCANESRRAAGITRTMEGETILVMRRH